MKVQQVPARGLGGLRSQQPPGAHFKAKTPALLPAVSLTGGSEECGAEGRRWTRARSPPDPLPADRIGAGFVCWMRVSTVSLGPLSKT